MEIQEKARTRKKNKKKEEEKKEIDVGDLGLTKRAYNCLIRAGINNLDDLANMTEEQLRGVGNLGKKSFEEIVDKMQEFGISFKTKEKSELIQRLLEQQQTIKAQQEEINRLKKILETPQQ